MTSPIVLWSTVFKHRHYNCSQPGYLLLEVTIFEQEDGAGTDTVGPEDELL